jgi:hypothetical protein
MGDRGYLADHSMHGIAQGSVRTASLSYGHCNTRSFGKIEVIEAIRLKLFEAQ